MSETLVTETVIDPAAVVVDPNAAPQDPPARPEYIPEKFWKDGTVDHEGLAKSYVALETKFHTARSSMVDVPESPEGYDLKPETLPDGVDWSDDAAKRFAGVFHEKGVSAEAAKAISTTFMELEAENHRLMSEAYEKQLEEGTAELKKEWGAAYESKVANIQNVVERLGYDPKDVELFSNPKVVKFLGKVVGQLTADNLPAAKGGVANGSQFTNGADEANRIMTDKSHPEHEAYVTGDRGAIDKVRKLLNG